MWDFYAALQYKMRHCSNCMWMTRESGPHECSRLRQGFGGRTHISPSKL
jgi:hypothetical protein